LRFVYREIENAWIDCPLGPQRIDYHDGFADDCNGGVFHSIAIGSKLRILGWTHAANEAGLWESQVMRRVNLSGFTVRREVQAYSHARVKTLALDTGFPVFRLVRVSRDSRQHRRASRL